MTSASGGALARSFRRSFLHTSCVASLGLCAFLSLGSSLGCATATQNVRAMRAYAMEDANIRVSLDRTEDLVKSLELVDRLLFATPYTPGDTWVRRLPLRSADAKVIRDDVKTENPYKDGEWEVPVLKLYRRWIENTLNDHTPPPEKAKYKSVVDAIAVITGDRAPKFKGHWELYHAAVSEFSDATAEFAALDDTLTDDATRRAKAKELELARTRISNARAKVEASKVDIATDVEHMSADESLTAGEKGQIVRDALTVLSIAYRLELESLALIPVVIIQTVRAIPTAPKELINNPSLKAVRQIYRLPGFLSGIKEKLSRQIPILESMTGTYAKLLKSAVDDSPGFALKDSIVDTIVGVTLDSLRVDLKAGADAFFYTSIPLSKTETYTDDAGNVKVRYDFSDRRYRLDYKVSPIVLASARLDLVFDWIRLPGVANLGFGFSTDQMYKSGGTVENTSLSNALGIEGAFSTVFDFALGFLGVKSSAKIATFTAGTIEKVDEKAGGAIVDRAPLQFKLTQIDVGYDFLFLIRDESVKAWMEQLDVSFRYYDYSLPRILYELENKSTTPDLKDFRISRESPIQTVRSRYFMLGANARFGLGEAPRFSPFADISIFGGAGPSEFYYLKDATLADSSPNRDVNKQVALAINGGLGLGIRMRLLPRGSRVRLDIRAYYRADAVYSRIFGAESLGAAERQTEFRTIDLFHGPWISIRGAL